MRHYTLKEAIKEVYRDPDATPKGLSPAAKRSLKAVVVCYTESGLYGWRFARFPEVGEVLQISNGCARNWEDAVIMYIREK